ncbi:MAG TPA: Gfo/Idh/MocA family oxidoreductase [Chthoniobacter sp.]|nr:Gfo/Idh/MocA family oxidoreductase [Chthoniobacter sp.]
MSLALWGGSKPANNRKIMKAIRFGLIGYGAWGSHHARVIAGNAQAFLVAVAAHSEASQQAAREAHPAATSYGDYREMLAREALDVVAVVLPTHLHFEAATAVLERGCHLLLEKPMCPTLEQCDALLALARKQNRLIAIGHELRLSSLWGGVKRMIVDGAIGEPRYCLIELWRRPYRLGSDGWRYDIQRVGNWILEEPIHFFDLARWYFADVGNPVSVMASASARNSERPELQDNFSAILQFPGGAHAVVSQTLAAFEHHQTVKLTGTKGALWASWNGAMDRTLHPTFWMKHFDGETVRDVPIDKITGEVFELEDQVALVVAAIRDGAPLCATGEDGRWSVNMCLKAQESVQSGRIVPLP